ncbi:FeS assembly protein SufB [Candidatus Arthromitus sp. SFB-2]|nr:FeS assembly protein SufB [Candidatus Arthromitus sp. SFB-2]
MRIDDIDRSKYDFKHENYEEFISNKGLSKDIIIDISRKKDEPKWMTDFRLKSLEIYNNMNLPVWGPNIDELNIDNIVSYVKPNSRFSDDWEETPEYIKNTFDKLGILNAEKECLAGVEAQYDSEVVYHNVREDLKAQGVIYMHMELAFKRA